MIVFENSGILDIRAIKTFGVSSKEDKKSAIGYFGTGMKYAIAILLRENHKVNIITGGMHYEFGLKKARVRNDDFSFITMNDEELAYTTELGKDWELWMAFRELYSNMLDEPGAKASERTITSDFSDDKTYVLVHGNPFAKVYHDRDQYFLNPGRESIEKSRNIEFYTKTCERDGASIFFKGVRVTVSEAGGEFDYNILTGLTLTEDRTVKDGWSLQWELANAIVMLKDKKLIASIIMADELSYEAGFNFQHADGSAKHAKVFLEVVGKLRHVNKDVGMSQSAVEFHKKHTRTPTVLPGVSCHLNEVETKQLDKATTFCKGTLSLELDDFRLIIAKDLGKGQLGLANIEEGIMYISKQCFAEGTKRVAVALLEEYTHCKHRVHDETIEQKWVYLNQILSLGERLQGEPL